MAWVLQVSAPSALDQSFETAPAEKAWGWFGMPAAGEGSAFETAAAPWVYDFSMASDYYMWTAAEPPIRLARTLMPMGVG